MGRSNKRKSRSRQLQASHQRSWLTGRYAVMETLRAGRWPVLDLLLSDELDAATFEEIQPLAESAECHLEAVPAVRLAELCGSQHHQGLAARMAAYPYGAISDIGAADPSHSTPNAACLPLVVICDRIQDAFNFGAILRCCDAMGVSAAIIGSTGQTGVTPQVARSSSGAVNFVNIIQTDDLATAVGQLKEAKYTIAAASEKSAHPAWEQQLQSPLALIVGSEAYGVSPGLLSLCDVNLQIPMLGHVSSLNAAVAAGVLMYEIRRQQSAEPHRHQ